MGNTVWVLLEGQYEGDWDHSLMIVHEKKINKLADQVGVNKLSDFLDYSVIVEEYGGEVEVSFVEPCDVKDSLLKLINVINSEKSEKLNNHELLEELGDCLKKVELAEQAGNEVRLSVIP